VSALKQFAVKIGVTDTFKLASCTILINSNQFFFYQFFSSCSAFNFTSLSFALFTHLTFFLITKSLSTLISLAASRLSIVKFKLQQSILACYCFVKLISLVLTRAKKPLYFFYLVTLTTKAFNLSVS
jgi:hypothetical protein